MQPVVHEENCLAEEARIVWNKLAPLKVSAMAWRLLRDRLPTTSNLIRRGVPIHLENQRCYYCNHQEEIAQHLFMSCPRAVEVWTACYQWMGIPFASHINVKDHFLIHSGLIQGKKGTNFLVCVWECVVWSLWKARNNFIFKGRESSSISIVGEVKGRIWNWCLAKNFIHCNASFSCCYYMLFVFCNSLGYLSCSGYFC